MRADKTSHEIGKGESGREGKSRGVAAAFKDFSLSTCCRGSLARLALAREARPR